MNRTMQTFGFPGTLIAENAHWVVLLRPGQVTLGSLVLAAKSDAKAFTELEPAAFTALGPVVTGIEAALRTEVRADKINYLMLMMVDPHVHFHVIPRYAGSRSLRGTDFPDSGWPGPPDLASAIDADEGIRDSLIRTFTPYFRETA